MSVIFNMAVKLLIWVLLLIFNFMLYFMFGLLFMRLFSGGKKSDISLPAPGLLLLAGFFLYYSLFTLFAVPVMYRWRPLSLLSLLWGCFTAVIVLVSAVLNRKQIAQYFSDAVSFVRTHVVLCALIALLVFVQLIIVLYSYQFTLDAAYYVANVTTSVQTNSLNIYNPYTGDWQDHFEMRYFFATYALQDAVMCSWLKLAPLIQTKVVMASVVIIMTNMVCYMIGSELFRITGFSGERRAYATALMMFFAGLTNFFFTTIYTTSAFLLTRTYEGKSILANVILPGILYIYIRMLVTRKEAAGEKEGSGEKEEAGDNGAARRVLWPALFVMCFGSTVISNTSNMLVPAALLVLFVPCILMELVKGRRAQALKIAGGTLLCSLPGIVLSLVYVAYVKGMFVFYTYPR